MSFKCPKCSEKLKCTNSRPVSITSTTKQYFCKMCEIAFYSFEKLDPEGVPKRPYVKSGRYAGGFKKMEGII